MPACRQSSHIHPFGFRAHQRFLRGRQRHHFSTSVEDSDVSESSEGTKQPWASRKRGEGHGTQITNNDDEKFKKKHLLLGPLCKTSESQGSSKALVIYSFLLVLDWRKLYRMQNVHPFPSPNDSFDSVECPTVSCLDFHVMRALFQGMSGCFR